MKKVLLCIVLTVCTYQMYAYKPGTYLLDSRNPDYNVMWGQGVNDKKGCHPSYNYFCPSDLDDDDQCSHTLAGCAAVAMAQIMYKWGYPEKSKYSSYDWDKIPPVLTDGCSDDCPQLIRDCGEACNMHYQTFAGIHITGSWAVPSNVAKGFDDFDYGAYLYDLKDWRFGSAWADLIRSEIDCGRPVLMHGQKNVIDIKDRHYFVIDGYSKYDKDQFHVNWGWRGGSNGYYDLQSCGYSNGQDIIVGIAPKHTGTPHARITYSKITGLLTPKCPDGINDRVRYMVDNADSYECHVYDRSGKKIWACAGLVKNGYAEMWDGSATNPLPSTDYWYTAVFKNNFGDRVEVSDHVTLFNTTCPPGYDPTPTGDQLTESDDGRPTVSPNPTAGPVQINANVNIEKIEILDMNAKILFSESTNSPSYTIDASKFGKGIYVVRIITEESTFIERLLVK